MHLSEENSWYAFSRQLGDDQVIVVVNPGGDPRVVDIPLQKLDLPDGILLEDLITRGRYRVADQVLKLTLDPWSGVMAGTIREEF